MKKIQKKKNSSHLPTILVILGPTASGKSDLAVKIALKTPQGAEIISADSRQVYKGLDIGTGKITKKEMGGIPHHLLDVASPRTISGQHDRQFTVDRFRKMAEEKITDILSRGKLPVLCGGTGFYIQSIVDGVVLPDVKADKKLRSKLSTKTAPQLFALLKKQDPARAKNIDPQNRVRLIRAIEIAQALGKVPKIKNSPRYRAVQIGIKPTDKTLHARIHDRLIKRMQQGMVTEARQLHRDGLSWKAMESLGLEYRYLALFLQKKIQKTEMLHDLEVAIRQYAKRQMKWFQRDTRIKWLKDNKLEYNKIKGL